MDWTRNIVKDIIETSDYTRVLLRWTVDPAPITFVQIGNHITSVFS